jgi:hypothetical protein
MQPVRLVLVEDMPMEAEVAIRRLTRCEPSSATRRRRETPEQFETLAHLGCYQSQGYPHSRPLSMAAIRTRK